MEQAQGVRDRVRKEVSKAARPARGADKAAVAGKKDKGPARVKVVEVAAAGVTA
jgi:hypothetical protein